MSEQTQTKEQTKVKKRGRPRKNTNVVETKKKLLYNRKANIPSIVFSSDNIPQHNDTDIYRYPTIVTLRIGKKHIKNHEIDDDINAFDENKQIFDTFDLRKITKMENEHLDSATYEHLLIQYKMLGDELGMKHMNNFINWQPIDITDDMICYRNSDFELIFDDDKETTLLQDKLNKHNPYTNTHLKIHIMKTIDSYDVKNDFMFVKDIKPQKNIACWTDGHTFTNKPFYIPFKYINGIYYVFGNFCSLGCVMRFIYDKYKHTDTFNRIVSMLYSFYNKCNPTFINDMYGCYKIPMASEVFNLTKYGGTYSIEKYRLYQYSDLMNTIFPPQVIAINYLIEEKYIDQNKNIKFIPVECVQKDDEDTTTISISHKFR